MPGIALDRKPTKRTDQLTCTAPKRREGSTEVAPQQHFELCWCIIGV